MKGATPEPPSTDQRGDQRQHEDDRRQPPLLVVEDERQELAAGPLRFPAAFSLNSSLFVSGTFTPG
jgi:hypothetical protein